ncbi:AhpA/YtjB family protein [Cognaticolwellia mytili]|uniref:AhpA/YtjB family protein n=1 Tax=Cognaticolwellia mytili TaxID=1888913 RepID=UPI000A16D7B4|nr:AhpA/YtjB family protein [Cognaticolwellia mytili]
MKQIEQPLYPKLSSIYNKILQLVIAMFLIIMVMNLWLTSRHEQEVKIQRHADTTGKMYLAQAAISSFAYLTEKNENLQNYVDNLAQQPLVKSVHIYGKTGQIIATSAASESVNDLFGIAVMKVNQSDDITPFVQELRFGELKGYIRLSLYRSLLVGDLASNSVLQYDTMRLLMIVAGVIGFLLTRGLNRFSRQGFRPPEVNK